MARKVYAFTSSTIVSGSSFIVPNDWNNAVNSIEGIGRGGNTNPDINNNSSGGAGGGAYVRSDNVRLIPGQSVYIGLVFSGGTLGFWANWKTNTVPTSASDGIFAASGLDGNTGSALGGNGGLDTDCIGQVAFSGGSGGLGNLSINTGGGGGGAAGPGGAGKNGGDGDQTTAGNDAGGGGGGAGGGSSTAGTNGTIASGPGGNGPTGTGGGTTTVAATVGGGGAGGGQGQAGFAGGAGVDIATVTHSTGTNNAIAIGIVVGAGGGGGGTGNGGIGYASGGSYGGGAGGSNATTTGVSAAPGLIVISYEPVINKMFMAF